MTPNKNSFHWTIAFVWLALGALPSQSAGRRDFRPIEESFSLRGREVKDSQGKKLGKIRDLALDLENGRIVEVIVASGGFLGIGQRTVAVPPQSFIFNGAEGSFHLNMDAKMFGEAPEFEMSKWAEHSQSQRVAEVYRYYGEKPYFAADGAGSPSGNTAIEPLGFVERSSKLLHLPVRSLENELLGRVNTFQYDLPGGRVFHVVVAAPGPRPSLSVIPARSLRFNAAHDALHLDMSAQAFYEEPRFRWTTFQKGDYQQESYSNTTVAANRGVDARRNAQSGTSFRYTPLAQGSSFADKDTTARIYAAMRADPTLSQNAQNVEIGTVHGRVTLRGRVNTEEGKRIINEFAVLAGRPENVSNLLEVRPVPILWRPTR
jgi:hypothetical protein